ncbi:MAG: transporter associated domain-containing protein [Prevotella sp.]|nr:transporter associated domain-containing protein [Prevotella sp.]
MRTPYFVPESKPIDELFAELKRSRNLMAIVIDEYGGTAGIVTMEDILEEIVGEIYDEHDKVEENFKKIDDNTYIINAEMTIYDVEEILGIHIQEGDYDTLSGYIIEKMGRIPTEKDIKKTIRAKEMIYTIEEIRDKHITFVKASRVE